MATAYNYFCAACGKGNLEWDGQGFYMADDFGWNEVVCHSCHLQLNYYDNDRFHSLRSGTGPYRFHNTGKLDRTIHMERAWERCLRALLEAGFTLTYIEAGEFFWEVAYAIMGRRNHLDPDLGSRVYRFFNDQSWERRPLDNSSDMWRLV